MIYFLLRLPQLDTVDNLYRRLDPSVVNRLVKLPYSELFAMPVAPAGVYIFTGLDQLSDAQNEAAAQIWNSLSESGSVLLNRPGQILGRYELLTALYTRGSNEFRVSRATELTGVEPAYPVFVRSDRQHTGPLSPLLHARSEVVEALRKAKLWGYAMDDLLVVEYCHTRDEDGYFRKYSAYRIGNEIIPCNLEHCRNWIVKRVLSEPKAGAPELVREELEFVEENPHASDLERIFDVANIQYGRIDYAIRGGRFQVWEINTAPSYGGGSRRRDPARDREREARLRARTIYYGRISDTLNSLDLSVAPGETAVKFDRRLIVQIQKDIRTEKAVVRAQKVKDAARSVGLPRLGRLKLPLSWVLARMMNRRG